MAIESLLVSMICSIAPVNGAKMEQKKIFRTALYTRVSTVEQNSELQLRDLQSQADREGWQLVDTYQDTISGCNANRPGLSRPPADALARKFDCLLVWKLDRFGRSLIDCLDNIRTLEYHGVRFIAVTQRLDTDHRNPACKFLFHVLGAAAEFEKYLVRERSQAGHVRYRQDFASGNMGNTVHGRARPDLTRHTAKEVVSRGPGH